MQNKQKKVDSVELANQDEFTTQKDNIHPHNGKEIKLK